LKSMEIRILFDNKKEDIRYVVGWGVSYLVNGDILFDAGENEEMLFHNMRLMDIRPDQIKKIVISHEHWDHVGGLWRLITGNPGVPVYICPGFSREFKDRIISSGANAIEVGPFTEIDRNIYTSGEIQGSCRYGRIPEQVLILRSKKGISVVTGCAHNGIADILKSINERMPGPIHLVLGGFHTLDMSASVVGSVIKRFQQMGVGKVAPTHCTGDEAIRLFKEFYGADFVEAVVGKTIHV